MKNREENKKIDTDGQEEVVFEDDEENISEDKKDAVKKLKEKLEKCEEEKNRYLTLWQKDKADFVNARKDDNRRNQEVIKFSKESVITEILPVLDSFEMAMKNPAWFEVSKEWRTGVEYIHSQLYTLLQNNGVEEINPLGNQFNTLEHHALESVSVNDEKKDHTVVEVTQKGYKLNGKIIRPAIVKVGEYKG